MIAVYLVLLFVFLAAFGGLKIGYMKKGNIMLSQILSIVAMHVIVLVQILLISGKLYRLSRLAGITDCFRPGKCFLFIRTGLRNR